MTQNYGNFFLLARRQGYTQHRSWYQSLQYIRLFNWLIELKDLGPEMKILDWGGGQGHASLMASFCGLRVTLFSIAAYADKWKQLHEYNVNTVYDAESRRALPFEDKSFDYSFSCGVLEHVRETGGNEYDSLAELVRVTSKRILIYHLPNKYSWIEFVTRNFFDSRYYHPYRYSKKDVLALVGAIEGVTISRMYRYGVLPRRIGNKLNGSVAGSILHAVDGLLLFSPLRLVSQCWCVELSVNGG